MIRSAAVAVLLVILGSNVADVAVAVSWRGARAPNSSAHTVALSPLWTLERPARRLRDPKVGPSLRTDRLGSRSGADRRFTRSTALHRRRNGSQIDGKTGDIAIRGPAPRARPEALSDDPPSSSPVRAAAKTRWPPLSNCSSHEARVVSPTAVAAFETSASGTKAAARTRGRRIRVRARTQVSVRLPSATCFVGSAGGVRGRAGRTGPTGVGCLPPPHRIG